MLSQLITAAVASCASRAVDSFAANAVAGQCRLTQTHYENGKMWADTPLIMHGSYHLCPGDEAVSRIGFYQKLLDAPSRLPQAVIAHSNPRLATTDGLQALVVLYHNRLYGATLTEPHPELFYCPNRGGHCESFPLSGDVYVLDVSKVSRTAEWALSNAFLTGALLGGIVSLLEGMLTGDSLAVEPLMSAAAAGGAGSLVSRRIIRPLPSFFGAMAANVGVQFLFDLLLRG